MSSGYVVTVTPTIMSGTVVRWHTSLKRAEAVEPFLSASRDRVIEHIEGVATPELLGLAESVVAALKRDDREAANRLATHRHGSFLGPLEPIANDRSTEGQ